MEHVDVVDGSSCMYPFLKRERATVSYILMEVIVPLQSSDAELYWSQSRR